MKIKKYRFFAHYNKPLSKQKNKTMWSVHFRDKCHMVENFVLKVPVESKSNKRQPFAVVQGFAVSVKLKNGVLYVE